MTKKLASTLFVGSLTATAILSSLIACTGNLGVDGSGGALASGGSLSGGGPGNGGAPSGGALQTGGSSTGGLSSGGTSAGGSNTGGANSGGSNTGGALSSGGAGGSASGGDSGYPPTFQTIERIVSGEIVSTSCGNSSCHNGEATPHFTSNENLHADLLNPEHIAEHCGNIPLVTPNDPTKSAFLMVIKDGCTDIGKMPSGCDPDPEFGNCVTPDIVAAVEQWILAGAPQ